ncbi:MAG TPA: M28 family peptidase [Thermoanaerobaculia bacterium]|nr:M28 family peptidase [Thermoanaerobaculia bacterium]
MAKQAGTKGAGEPRGAWGLIAGLALFALALLVVTSLGRPPEPKAKDAPATELSGGRALEVLRTLAGDGAPHPVGSPANAQVRERVMAQLRAIGYTPEVQEGFHCQPGWGCAKVLNVVARLPGREKGKAVLLSSHYDSVPAGPGVSDDLTSVAAVLEIARVLKTGPQLRNSVLILIDDGEEQGLLGARAFAETSPDADSVGAMVNLEARGTGGPSLMFETSGQDAWLIDAFASRAPRPFTSSLFSTVYHRMPNDTDMTVFQRRGLPGLNFAFIDNPSYYHTPLDNLEHASAATLQHQGDNALAAVRGLAEGDLVAPPAGNAVFFDVLHLFVIRWREGLSPVLGILALALCLAAAILARRKRLATWGGVAMGAVAPLLGAVLSFAVAFGLTVAVGRAFHSLWIARPLAVGAAFWLAALAVTLVLAGLLGRWFGAAGLWAGVWIGWSFLGLVTGLLLPGVSYLFLPAALVAGIVGVAVYATGGSALGRLAATLLPALVVALLWFPLMSSLYLALGLTGLVAVSVLLSFVFSTLVPLVGPAGALGRLWLPLAAFAGMVLGAVLTLAGPSNSPEVPRNVIVELHEDAGTGESRWVVRGSPPLPPAMRQLAAFGTPMPPYPWSPPRVRAFVAPAPPLNVPGPELAVVEDAVVEGKRHLRLHLTSKRGALVGSVAIPPAARIESVKLDGHAFAILEQGLAGSGAMAGWRFFSSFTLPPGGSDLEVVLGATEPQEWYAIDRSFGLPPSAQAMVAARPKNAVTIQDGDLVVVSRKVKI